MAFRKKEVLSQLEATETSLKESLEYYKAFKLHLDSCFPVPTDYLTDKGTPDKAAFNKAVIQHTGLTQHCDQAIQSAENQICDIHYHKKVLEMWQ